MQVGDIVNFHKRMHGWYGPWDEGIIPCRIINRRKLPQTLDVLYDVEPLQPRDVGDSHVFIAVRSDVLSLRLDDETRAAIVDICFCYPLLAEEVRKKLQSLGFVVGHAQVQAALTELVCEGEMAKTCVLKRSRYYSEE